NVAGSLNDLVPVRDPHGSGDAGWETVSCRIVVTAFAQVPADSFLDGPGLHRQFPVRRIDDEGLPRWAAAAGPFQSLVRASGGGFIESVQIRLAFRSPAEICYRSRRRRGHA